MISDTAIPWYKSQAILGILAAIILTIVQKLGYLGEVTQDELVQMLIIVIPMLVALYGRLTVTKPTITLTKAKAEEINGNIS